MSRLGDLLRTERMRRSLSTKQVAKLAGVSESYIADVEAGKRIIADDQARRILKRMGMQEHTEAGFTLDDIAATVDLATVKPGAPETPRAPAVRGERSAPESEVVATSGEDKAVAGSVWLDALSSVLKRVPVLNAVMQEVDHRLLPIVNGRVEGASPDKVFYYLAPDDSMRGFRVLRDDLVLIVPAASPIDGAVMLVEYRSHRALRKVKMLDATTMLLQSCDREYSAETVAVSDANYLGRAVRLEAGL